MLLKETSLYWYAHKAPLTNAKPSGMISDASTSFSSIELLNAKIRPLLREITKETDFFGYYRLDLYGKECPFWSEDGLCGNRACAVETIDDEAEIPNVWRASALGRLSGPATRLQASSQDKHPQYGASVGVNRLDKATETCLMEEDHTQERDFCVAEDESADSAAVYVSLVNNPERFTGYSGPGANKIWEAAYRENCFTEPSFAQRSSIFMELEKGSGHLQSIQNEVCLEKRVFYRIISGMHASISTHLCYDYLNQTSGHWVLTSLKGTNFKGPNVECFNDRIVMYPDRLENLYFNYALLLKAIAKLLDFFEDYTFCSGDDKIVMVARTVRTIPEAFNESSMFVDPSSFGLIDEFRSRFRNISRLMDCVGCDRCRLWGKLQILGYGTALKVLFDSPSDTSAIELQRTEIVALVNTFDRLSHSLYAVGEFRKLMKVIVTSSQQTFSHQFRKEMVVVFDALKMVIGSWVTLPRTLYRLGLACVVNIWDIFTGKVSNTNHWIPRVEL